MEYIKWYHIFLSLVEGYPFMSFLSYKYFPRDTSRQHVVLCLCFDLCKSKKKPCPRYRFTSKLALSSTNQSVLEIEAVIVLLPFPGHFAASEVSNTWIWTAAEIRKRREKISEGQAMCYKWGFISAVQAATSKVEDYLIF